MALLRGRKKFNGRSALRGIGALRATGQVYEAPVTNYTGQAELTGFDTSEASGSVPLVETSDQALLNGQGDVHAEMSKGLIDWMNLMGVGTSTTNGYVGLGNSTQLTGAMTISTQGAVFIPVMLEGQSYLRGGAVTIVSSKVDVPALTGYGDAGYGDGSYGG